MARIPKPINGNLTGQETLASVVIGGSIRISVTIPMKYEAGVPALVIYEQPYLFAFRLNKEIVEAYKSYFPLHQQHLLYSALEVK